MHAVHHMCRSSWLRCFLIWRWLGLSKRRHHKERYAVQTCTAIYERARCDHTLHLLQLEHQMVYRVRGTRSIKHIGTHALSSRQAMYMQIYALTASNTCLRMPDAGDKQCTCGCAVFAHLFIDIAISCCIILACSRQVELRLRDTGVLESYVGARRVWNSHRQRRSRAYGAYTALITPDGALAITLDSTTVWSSAAGATKSKQQRSRTR